MYFTIQNSNNKPILRGKLSSFGTHIASSEVLNTQTFFAHITEVEILDKEQVKEFEDLYRRDHKRMHDDDENRSYYVFQQPIFRGKYHYIITKNGYKTSDLN